MKICIVYGKFNFIKVVQNYAISLHFPNILIWKKVAWYIKLQKNVWYRMQPMDGYHNEILVEFGGKKPKLNLIAKAKVISAQI